MNNVQCCCYCKSSNIKDEGGSPNGGYLYVAEETSTNSSEVYAGDIHAIRCEDCEELFFISLDNE